MVELLDPSDCPSWVKYPESFLKLLKSKQHIFLPWYLFDEADDIVIRWKGLEENYPKRKLFPFARRDDNDDIACWEESLPGKVVVIHDFDPAAWEQRKVFDSFEDWYQFALSLREEDED